MSDVSISKRSLSKLLNYAQGPVKLPDDHFAAEEAKTLLDGAERPNENPTPTGKVIPAKAPQTSSSDSSEDKHWHQFVCEVCGTVEKLPWTPSPRNELPENMPWCHHGNNYCWAFGDIERARQMKEHGWVMMKLATVMVDYDPDATQELHYPDAPGT